MTADSKNFDFLSVFRMCLKLLDVRDRYLLFILVAIQMSLSLLDLVGVILIGLIVSVATSAVQGQEIPKVISNLVEFIGITAWTPQDIAKFFATIAVICLVLKSTLTYILNFRSLTFLSTREVKLSTKMANLVFSQPLTILQRFGTPDYLYALTRGSSAAMVGVLGGTASLASEIFLQIIMASTLFAISPTLLLFFITYFGIIFLVLFFSLNRRASELSEGATRAHIENSKSIFNALGAYREIVATGRQKYFLSRFEISKSNAGNLSVKQSMLSQVSKYIFENALVVGGVFFAAYAFLTNEAIQAASMLAIFIVASSRIAPSILKIQVGFLSLKGALGGTSRFFDVYNHVSLLPAREMAPDQTVYENQGVLVENVTLVYPGSDICALKDVSFELENGKFNAFVGPSGSGKSTLADLIMGVIEPTRGKVSFMGVSAPFMTQNKISVGYVPQAVFMSDDSLIKNVCFGLEEFEISEDRVWEVLKTAQLYDWAINLPDGLNSRLGESGHKLSGGQRQRVGLARALYSEPSLLVLDEATSALDSKIEDEISKVLKSLGTGITKIVIAHRLSTVMHADKVIYISDGEKKGEGTFEELRLRIPEFDNQAKLMGIT
jgi:ABC-type multidrug transport system fused ATPase/permease subunit